MKEYAESKDEPVAFFQGIFISDAANRVEDAAILSPVRRRSTVASNYPA